VWKVDVYGGKNDWQKAIPADWKKIVFKFDFGGGRAYSYNAIDLLDTETAKDSAGTDLGYVYDNVKPRHPLPRRRSFEFLNTVASTGGRRLELRTDTPTIAVAESGERVSIPLGGLSVGDKPRTTAPAALSSTERSRAESILKDAAKLEQLPRGSPLSASIPPAEGRVVVHVGQIRLPPRNVQLRFFLNKPDATPETPGTDPSFIGSFNFIPSSDEPTTVDGFEIEITDAVAGKLNELSRAQVTVVPRYAGEKDENVEIKDMVLEVR
jgi:hypothetical protein